MIIKSVKLENIRSYTNQEISFPGGSVLLSGDIGSGKSTVLLAIEFAFFGIRGKQLSGESLLRNGKNQGSVELKLEVDGKEVIVKRMLKRSKESVKQESGYIIINGVKKEATPVELKSIILDILGYPRELVTKSKALVYRYTVYTPQEEMKQILTDDKDSRLDTLRKVFGIDRYKRIRENTMLFTRHIREIKSKLEGETLDLEDKKKALKEHEEEMKGLTENLRSIKDNLDRITNEIQIVENEMLDRENNVKKLNELKRQYEVNDAKLSQKIELHSKDRENARQLEKRIREIKGKISEIKTEEYKNKEEDVEKAMLEKERALQSAVDNTNSVREELASVMANIDELKKAAAEAGKIETKLKKARETLSNAIEKVKPKEELRQEIQKNESMLNDIAAKAKSFESSRQQAADVREKVAELENCPTCYQEVADQHKKHIHRIESDKIDAYDRKKKDAEKEMREKQEHVLKLKQEFDRIIEGEKDIERLNAEIRNLEERSGEINEKRIKLSRLTDRKDELNSKITKKEEIAILRKKVDELKELLKKIRQNNQQLNEKKHLSEMLAENEQRLSELSGARDNLKREIGELNAKKIELTSEMNKFADAEKLFIKAKEKHSKLKEKAKAVEVSKASLQKETEGLKKVMDLLKLEIEKKEKAKKKLGRQNELHNWLNEYFVNLMSVIERNVLSRIYNEFNELFVKWFNMLIEDEMVNARLDSEFTPVIEQNGYEVAIGNMSGGEKTACALAYRLALNKVINDVMSRIKTNDVIILDEPTDGFSSEQLDKMRDVLDELEVRQVIIVSHEAKIETYVDNVIKIKKDEHISAVEGAVV